LTKNINFYKILYIFFLYDTNCCIYREAMELIESALVFLCEYIGINDFFCFFVFYIVENKELR